MYKLQVLLRHVHNTVCCSMIVILLASLAFYATGYYVALAWMSLSIAFFLVCLYRCCSLSFSPSFSFFYLTVC